MHGLIIADIEGIIGIYDFMNDVENSKVVYTREIEVYIKAFQKNGVEKITVCDAHSAGDMILPRIVTENVALVSTVNNLSFDEKYDFAIMVGFHGRGEAHGIFPHTFRFDFKHIFIRGNPVGEVEIFVRWLGAKGVPVILVTGDREATYEANCFNIYRDVCCVRSLFQSTDDAQALYHKLAAVVDSSMLLDYDKCISSDEDEVNVQFCNPDTSKLLSQKGYLEKDGKILFASCSEFVEKLYQLIDEMNKINEFHVKINTEFLQTVRTLIKSHSREEVENSEIAHLLKTNRYFLDEASRHRILAILGGQK